MGAIESCCSFDATQQEQRTIDLTYNNQGGPFQHNVNAGAPQRNTVAGTNTGQLASFLQAEPQQPRFELNSV